MSRKTITWLLMNPTGYTMLAWFVLMSASTAILIDYLVGGRR